MDVTILIATFGRDEWYMRGLHCHDEHQHFGKPVVYHHDPDGTIASTRNKCVDIADEHGVGQGWLCFVDADDMLEPGYFEPMADAVEQVELGRVWPLLAPAVRYGVGSDPQVFRDRHIRTINPCVIGTLIHRAVFEAAGRFWEERAWEDWSLFRRAWLIGAEVVHVEDAVYRDNAIETGRNSTVDHPQRLHAEIIASHTRWKEQQS